MRKCNKLDCPNFDSTGKEWFCKTYVKAKTSDSEIVYRDTFNSNKTLTSIVECLTRINHRIRKIDIILKERSGKLIRSDR
jgi:hypothetical protein